MICRMCESYFTTVHHEPLKDPIQVVNESVDFALPLEERNDSVDGFDIRNMNGSLCL